MYSSIEFKNLISFSKENALPCKEFLYKFGAEKDEIIHIQIIGDHLNIENERNGFQDGCKILSENICYGGLNLAYEWLRRDFRKITAIDKKTNSLKKVFKEKIKNNDK